MDSFYDFYLKRKRYEKQCVLGKKINIKLNILPTIYFDSRKKGFDLYPQGLMNNLIHATYLFETVGGHQVQKAKGKITWIYQHR